MCSHSFHQAHKAMDALLSSFRITILSFVHFKFPCFCYSWQSSVEIEAAALLEACVVESTFWIAGPCLLNRSTGILCCRPVASKAAASVSQPPGKLEGIKYKVSDS